MTIAALMPREHDLRLVDLNCEALRDEDLAWADLVCFSAMLRQQQALLAVADRCRAAGKVVVFGGPYPAACPDRCRPHCDVLVLNEAK